MTEIQVYRSFFEADSALEHYCRQNLKNELLAEDRIDGLPEGVKLKDLDIAEDITFNFLFGLGSSRLVGPKYTAAIGLDYITSNGFCAGISIDALVKNIRKSLIVQHKYGAVGAKANPIFYTIEKESGIFKSIKRIPEISKRPEFLLIALLVEWNECGLNAGERDEFAKLVADKSKL